MDTNAGRTSPLLRSIKDVATAIWLVAVVTLFPTALGLTLFLVVLAIASGGALPTQHLAVALGVIVFGLALGWHAFGRAKRRVEEKIDAEPWFPLWLGGGLDDPSRSRPRR